MTCPNCGSESIPCWCDWCNLVAKLNRIIELLEKLVEELEGKK